jgi:hypothetical protein
MKKLNNYLMLFKLLLVILAFTMNSNYLYSQCVSCDGTETSGLFPSAIGRYTKANGDYSFSGGYYSEVNGALSFAFGNRVFVTGSHSVGMGMFVRTIGTSAMALGSGNSITSPLVNDIDRSLMIGFGSTKPTFFVGESIGINNTGRIGIGNVTSPEAKLHIRADAGEDANLMLQATGLGKKAILKFDGGPGIIANMDRYAPLLFSAGGHENTLAIRNGRVGVGIDNPTNTLDINGQVRIRGGNPGAGKVLTSDVNGNTSWQTPSGGSNWTVSGSNIYRSTGNVGIGTISPGTVLHVHKAVSGGYSYVHRIEVTGTATDVNQTKALEVRANSTSDAFLVYGDGRIVTKGAHLLFNRTGNSSIRANDDLSFRTNNVERIRITKDGNVAIGATDPKGYKLAVKGNVIAEEVVVKLHGSWPDYVFEDGYMLKSIEEVENFINVHGHLPEVPSAQHVAADGISLGEMNALMMKKIEELTLYVIGQQKEINELKDKLADIENQ